MSGIQSTLALGALMILGMISLRFNSSVLDNMTVEIENKVYLTGFSLADNLIEEIKEKAFDENTIDFQAIPLNKLTAPGSLRTEGEVHPYFDDIDDYNTYQDSVNLPHAEGYKVTCAVTYSTATGQTIYTQSFYKKVVVTVESKYLRSPINMSFIFSLHAKN
jgi:hypothetical protein